MVGQVVSLLKTMKNVRGFDQKWVWHLQFQALLSLKEILHPPLSTGVHAKPSVQCHKCQMPLILQRVPLTEQDISTPNVNHSYDSKRFPTLLIILFLG